MNNDSPRLTRPMAHYVHSRRVGSLIFLAGQGCRDSETNTYRGLTRAADGSVSGYDIKEMTRAVFRNMENALKALGLGLDNIVDVTVFLKSMSDFEAMNAVWNDEFHNRPAPTRTTVAVLDLPGENFVEMKAIAADSEHS